MVHNSQPNEVEWLSEGSLTIYSAIQVIIKSRNFSVDENKYKCHCSISWFITIRCDIKKNKKEETINP